MISLPSKLREGFLGYALETSLSYLYCYRAIILCSWKWDYTYKISFIKSIHRYIKPHPEWSVFREASFGHGELKIVNSTHAFWSWHRNDDDEQVRSDQVWINSLIGSGCLAEKGTELREVLLEH